jgi:N-acetylglucosaminyl-diphospho-decaprenol L-rhamnosyltransferase
VPDQRVGIVLLTYNCAHRLGVVLAQLARCAAPIVAVDNASSDGTPEVLGEHGIPTITLPTNLGAAARNVGADHLDTPYVAFCDDDGWFEPDALRVAADLFDRHPRLALVNARILVGKDRALDPISAEMRASPLEDTAGIPGRVLLGFMAGAVILRRTAFLEVGGYDREFFIGAEEDTLAVKLARAGWHMRYIDDAVVVHHPSLANAAGVRKYVLRNALWTCWLHRRPISVMRRTVSLLRDEPMSRDWMRGVSMALRGLPWVLRRRSPMSRALDHQYRMLERRGFPRRHNAPVQCCRTGSAQR